MINKLGGRKTVITVVILAVATAVDAVVGLSNNLMQLFQVALGAYAAGNAAEHASKAYQEGKKTGKEKQIEKKVGDLTKNADEKINGGLSRLEQVMAQNSEILNEHTQKMQQMVQTLQSMDQAEATTQNGVSQILQMIQGRKQGVDNQSQQS